MYKLNDHSKSYIKDKLGISFDKIIDLDSSELDAAIENNISKKLEHKPTFNINSMSRGTPYLYFWRLVDLKVIDKLLSKI